MSVISVNRFKEITSKFNSVDPIFVLGDVGIDKYTYGDVRRISPEAPVPVLEVTKEWMQLGLAANIAHNLETLSIRSSLCGVIGEDERGDLFNKLMNKGVKRSNLLVQIPGRPTTFKERIVTNTQQICRVDYETKNEISEGTLDILIDKVERFADSHSALILEDYAKGMFCEKLVERTASVFRERGKLVTCDPNRNTPPLFFKGVDLLKPNKIEAEVMVKALGYRETNVKKMAEILIDKLNLKMIVITLGGDGMALVDTRKEGEMTVIPTVAKEVFDVSGAGDTAISAITASLVSGATLEEACWIGNCASGVVVGKNGTSTVSLDELTKFHAEIYDQLA